MTNLEMVIDYAEKVYAEKELLGAKVGNISLTVAEVAEVIKELKESYTKINKDDKKSLDKKGKIGGQLWKAQYLHKEMLKEEKALFLKGEAEVFTVKKIIEQKPSNKSLRHKMIVEMGLGSPFRMEVSVLNPNGVNKDTGEKYDYLKVALPFERTWKKPFKAKDGSKGEKTVYEYDMDICRSGEEGYYDKKNTWENIKGALLSGYMRYMGVYKMEYKRLTAEKKEKMKTKKYDKSCENCRWHFSEEVADETESGVTKSFWRHKCALTGETVDDTAHEFFEQDRKEDKGALQKGAKAVRVNKHGHMEAELKPKTRSTRYIKENALYDFGKECPFHLFKTNFNGYIDDWYIERPLGLMPTAKEVFEDEEGEFEFMLPDGIIVDFDEVEYVPFNAPAEEEKKDIEIPLAMKENRILFKDDDVAEEVARAHCKKENLSPEDTKVFVEKYLALK